MAIIRMNYLSEYLGMQTNVTLVIPTFTFADYFSGTPRMKAGDKLQTLWLLHGGSGDDLDFISGTRVARYAEENKIAVVCPADYNMFYTDTYTGNYFSYITEELFETLATIYPLSQRREDNFIAGLSMGAIGAFKAGIVYNDRYGTVLCMSGGGRDRDDLIALMRKEGDLSPRPPYMTYYPRLPEENGVDDPWGLAKLKAERGEKLPKFFVTCGEDDGAMSRSVKTAEYLTSLGVEVEFEGVPGYKHEWDFWDLALKKAIYDKFSLRRAPISADELGG